VKCASFLEPNFFFFFSLISLYLFLSSSFFFSHPFFVCQSRGKWVELKRFLDPLGFPPPFQHRRSSQGHSGYKSFWSGMLVSPGMPVQTGTVQHLGRNRIGGSFAPDLALARKIPAILAGTEQNSKHCLTVQSSYSTYALYLTVPTAVLLVVLSHGDLLQSPWRQD